jgi:hypothetical protein
MTEAPEDWVLLEAAKRWGWTDAHTLDTLRRFYDQAPSPYRALCDMIAKHEQKPVDRKLLCALEAAHQWDGTQGPVSWVGRRAIELFEGGYGK